MKKIGFINSFVNKIIRHSDWYKFSLFGGATKFWRFSQFKLQLVNLGSGAAVHAFSYQGLPVKAANWALGPQSLVHDFNILKNYFSYIQEDGIVIITVCPFSGLVSQYDKKHNLKYYTFLHPATVMNFDDEERLKALKFKSDPFGSFPALCVKAVTKEYVFRVLKKFKKERNTNLEDSAQMIMNGWKKQFDIEDLSVTISSQHAKDLQNRKEILIEIAKFCRKRSLRPIIVIPVIHKSLEALFPVNFKSLYMDRLLNGIDIPVLDYMNDEIGNASEYFSTALFLNHKGSMVFTKRVFNDINKVL